MFQGPRHRGVPYPHAVRRGTVRLAQGAASSEDEVMGARGTVTEPCFSFYSPKNIHGRTTKKTRFISMGVVVVGYSGAGRRPRSGPALGAFVLARTPLNQVLASPVFA